ncbi:MAG: hypothetical protein KGI50_07975 [Patescibacteria group bacterium]|nr:hypothetical protein [Patescibacteria group bacterium]
MDKDKTIAPATAERIMSIAKEYADKNPHTEFSVQYKERHKREYPETQFHDNG